MVATTTFASRKRIPVDFTAIARDGKIKVWLFDTEGAQVGQIVELYEEAEGMQMPAVLSEVDGDFAYFDLDWQKSVAQQPYATPVRSHWSSTGGASLTPRLNGPVLVS